MVVAGGGTRPQVELKRDRQGKRAREFPLVLLHNLFTQAQNI